MIPRPPGALPLVGRPVPFLRHPLASPHPLFRHGRLVLVPPGAMRPRPARRHAPARTAGAR